MFALYTVWKKGCILRLRDWHYVLCPNCGCVVCKVGRRGVYWQPGSTSVTQCWKKMCMLTDWQYICYTVLEEEMYVDSLAMRLLHSVGRRFVCRQSCDTCYTVLEEEMYVDHQAIGLLHSGEEVYVDSLALCLFLKVLHSVGRRDVCWPPGNMSVTQWRRGVCWQPSIMSIFESVTQCWKKRCMLTAWHCSTVCREEVYVNSLVLHLFPVHSWGCLCCSQCWKKRCMLTSLHHIFVFCSQLGMLKLYTVLEGEVHVDSRTCL